VSSIGSPHPAAPPPEGNRFQEWLSILVAVSSAIGSFFGLFGGILSGIAPPVDIAGQPFAADAARMYTCMALLVVYAIALATGRAASIRGWALATAALVLCAGTGFVLYNKTHNDLVFRYPPDAEPGAQSVYVAGIRRLEVVENDPVSRALGNANVLKEWGGDSTKVWTDASQSAGRARVLYFYLGFVVFTGAAFFVLAELVRRLVLGPLQASGPRPPGTESAPQGGQN
jgi:hypothetical protein